jgi:hypothetical protein
MMIYFFNTNPAIQRNQENILGFECKTLSTKYLGIPLTNRALQNGNLGRISQQAIGEGEKLDVQIPQPCEETCIDQDDSASNSNLYDVHISFPQRNNTKNKGHPKGLPMVRSGNKEKMGLGGLGEGLQAKMKRRIGPTRPTSNQQSLWGETLVAMG